MRVNLTLIISSFKHAVLISFLERYRNSNVDMLGKLMRRCDVMRLDVYD